MRHVAGPLTQQRTNLNFRIGDDLPEFFKSMNPANIHRRRSILREAV